MCGMPARAVFYLPVKTRREAGHACLLPVGWRGLLSVVRVACARPLPARPAPALGVWPGFVVWLLTFWMSLWRGVG